MPAGRGEIFGAAPDALAAPVGRCDRAVPDPRAFEVGKWRVLRKAGRAGKKEGGGEKRAFDRRDDPR
jgi:hypothetical protein